jgi:hypothetical protein
MWTASDVTGLVMGQRPDLLNYARSDTSPKWLASDMLVAVPIIMSRLNLNTRFSIPFLAFVSALTLTGAGTGLAGPVAEPVPLAEPSRPPDENSHELFDYETVYTLRSDFRDDNGKLGHGDSLYNDFSYDHRFLITGKWYFRTGVEYERFDFGGSNNGLPDHLQSIYAHVALEYVVHDHAGAGIELDPGAYFEDNITSDAIDVPWKVFAGFPLKKDKIFAFIGLGGGLYQHPIIAPGGGLVVLFSDKLRLEGVFPKPALVYEPTDDWQFRIQANLYYESFRTDNVFTTEKKIQLHNAVVQYNEDRVGLQAKYKGIKHVEVIGGVGCTVFREFDFFRADRRAKLDPAPYAQAGVQFRF